MATPSVCASTASNKWVTSERTIAQERERQLVSDVKDREERIGQQEARLVALEQQIQARDAQAQVSTLVAHVHYCCTCPLSYACVHARMD